MKKSGYWLVTLALVQGTAAFGGDKPQQLVIVSYDGAHDNALWTRSLEIARANNAHFTYFLSCTFLMSPEQRSSYKAPHEKKGRSNVGFAQSREEVETRLAHIWQARADGHDIASHACGHFDGAHWSKDDWEGEFESFKSTLIKAYKANGLADAEPDGWKEFVEKEIKGFRAPYLSVSNGLIPALKSAGYTYDASLVSRGSVMPEPEKGVLRFSLPLVPEGPRGRDIIAMDYNLFVRHSKAEETPERRAEFEERAYNAFRAEFDRQYSGDRIPLQLGFHFVEMNGSAYWNAMERLVSEVCNMEDVSCVSYAEAIDRMSTNGKLAGVTNPGL